MTVATVTFNGTRVSAAENITGLSSIGGGSGASAEPSFAYQPPNQWNRKRTGTGGFAYTGGSQNFDGTKAFIRKVAITDFAGLNAVSGDRLRIGSSNSAYGFYTMSGSDSPVPSWSVFKPRNGTTIKAVDPSIVGYRTSTSGSPNAAAVDYYGLDVNFSASTAKSENVGMDALDVAVGLTLEGGGSGGDVLYQLPVVFNGGDAPIATGFTPVNGEAFTFDLKFTVPSVVPTNTQSSGSESATNGRLNIGAFNGALDFGLGGQFNINNYPLVASNTYQGKIVYGGVGAEFWLDGVKIQTIATVTGFGGTLYEVYIGARNRIGVLDRQVDTLDINSATIRSGVHYDYVSGSSDEPATYQDVFDFDEGTLANRYGLFFEYVPDTFGQHGTLQKGSSGLAVNFKDLESTVFYPDSMTASGYTRLLDNLENAASSIVDGSSHKGLGNTNITDTRPIAEVVGTNGAAQYGRSINNFASVTYNSAVTVDGETVDGSGLVTQNGATITDLTVLNGTDPFAVKIDDLSKVAKLFTDGSIDLTSSLAETFSLTNIKANNITVDNAADVIFNIGAGTVVGTVTNIGAGSAEKIEPELSLMVGNIPNNSLIILYDDNSADPQNLGDELDRFIGASGSISWGYTSVKAGDIVAVKFINRASNYKIQTNFIPLQAGDTNFNLIPELETN